MKKIYNLILAAALCFAGNVWATTPFSEGFETSLTPEGWSTIHVKGSSWQRASSDYYVSVHGGSYYAKIAYSSSGGDNYLITPQLSPVNGETLQFYLASQTWGGSTLTVEVSEASNTNAADFTTVLATYQSKVDLSTEWGEEKEISLSAYAGKNIYIAFHMVDKNGDNVYLDDVSIIAPASCPKPSALDYSKLTNTSVELSWTKGDAEENWDVFFKAGSEEWDSIAVNSNPYTLALDPATSYQVKVRASCGGDEVSDFSNVISFTSERCAPENIKAYHYELTDSYGDGWDGSSLQVKNVASDEVIVSLTLPKNASSGSGNFNLCCGETYSFVWVNGGGNYDKECGFTITCEETVILEHDAGTAPTAGVLLDNHEFACGGVTCAKPTGVAATSLEAKAATIGWTAAEGQDTWAIQVTTDKTNWGDSIVVEENPFKVTSLQANTTYYARVKAICGNEDESDWSAPSAAFTTDKACYEPTLPTKPVTEITGKTATFTWNASTHGETEWQWVIVEKDEEPDWTGVDVIDSTHVDLTGLKPITNYDLYVRSYCNDEDQSTAVKASFKTDCAPVEDADLPKTLDLSGSNWAAPACWVIASTSDGAYSAYIYNNELRFSGNNSSSYLQRRVVATLPEFEKDIQELTVTITYEMGGTTTSYPVFIVGYTDDPSTPANFHGLDTLAQVTSSTTTEAISLEKADKGTRIAVCYTNPVGATGDKTAYITEITVAEKSSTPSALENTFVNGKSIKRLENGQLVIENNGVIYNAQGVRVGK